MLANGSSRVPAFLKVAQDQLTAGIASRNTPDWRMLVRNGIDTSEANAKYFEETLPKLAEERIAGPQRDELLKQVREGSQQAAAAFRGLARFRGQHILRRSGEEGRLRS